MKKNTNKIKFWLAILIIFAAFVGNIIRYSQRAPRRHYSDWRVYYATGDRFLNKKDIYSRPDEAITPFKYSPIFAMAFSPLSMLPKHMASLVFFTINFLSVIGICYFSKKILDIDDLTYGQYWILFFLPILFTSRFIILVWDAGQVNLIMVFLVVLCLYFIKTKQFVKSSACLAFSILFKYMPAVFLPYFFVKRKFKQCLYVLGFILFFSFLPTIYIGFDKAILYLTKWFPFISGTSFDLGSWVDYKNQSIYSMVLRFTMDLSPYSYNYSHTFLNLTFLQGLGISIILGMVIYYFTLAKGAENKSSQSIDYALLFVCMAVFNPNAWMVNFVSLLFVYIFLVYYLIKNKWRDKITLILVILAFALSNWMSESVVGNDLENLFEELSSVTFACLLLIICLFRLKFRKLYQEV